MVRRGDIWLVALDPTIGSEIQKTRPAVVISPDDLNRSLRTFLIAPMTTGSRPAPFRPVVTFGGKTGLVLTDQIRTVDRKRMIKCQGTLDPSTLDELLAVLRETFTP